MPADDRECGSIVHGEPAEMAARSHSRPPTGLDCTPLTPSDDACLNNPLNSTFPMDWLHRLAEHAASAAPAECCGLILRDGVRPCRNALPENSARIAYLLSPADAIFIAENADSGAILAIYHSHPNAPADWSDRDDQAARFAGAPLYPNISRLIIGCRDGAPFEFGLVSFIRNAWRPSRRWPIHP